MKHLMLALSIVTVFSSCEKFELFDKENPCAIVAPEKIPSTVSESFKTKYPGVTVDTWFNKDNNGYAASFKKDGTERISLFDNDGNFQSEIDEDNDDDNDGDHEDGCDCDSENED
jgi:hypothetical protein